MQEHSGPSPKTQPQNWNLVVWFDLDWLGCIYTWYDIYDAFHVVLLFAPNFHQLQWLQISMCHPDPGRRLHHGFAPSIPGGFGSEGGRRADKYGSNLKKENSCHMSQHNEKLLSKLKQTPSMLSHIFRLVSQNEHFPGTTFFLRYVFSAHTKLRLLECSLTRLSRYIFRWETTHPNRGLQWSYVDESL